MITYVSAIIYVSANVLNLQIMKSVRVTIVDMGINIQLIEDMAGMILKPVK